MQWLLVALAAAIVAYSHRPRTRAPSPLPLDQQAADAARQALEQWRLGELDREPEPAPSSPSPFGRDPFGYPWVLY